jgi:hypothetical protein
MRLRQPIGDDDEEPARFCHDASAISQDRAGSSRVNVKLKSSVDGNDIWIMLYRGVLDLGGLGGLCGRTKCSSKICIPGYNQDKRLLSITADAGGR